jgi:16S rRNA (uracil1498-N3)-methyltransferase
MPLPDLTLALAPIRSARLDQAVEKATEIGIAALQPVRTQFTQMSNLRIDKLRATAVEAAEQCGALGVPQVREPLSLDEWLAGREAGRTLVFCDEEAPVANPLEPLRAVAGGPIDLLIGPEGGFSGEERNALIARRNVLAISLGPRILRTETAVVAALMLVQAARNW